MDVARNSACSRIVQYIGTQTSQPMHSLPRRSSVVNGEEVPRNENESSPLDDGLYKLGSATFLKKPTYPTGSLDFLGALSNPNGRASAHQRCSVENDFRVNGTSKVLDAASVDDIHRVNGTCTVTTIPNINGTHLDHLKLKVIVVGAGLGGLATAIALARKGHSVTVLEQASRLGEVGAGIQIPPNSSRLLLEWGLGPFLGDKTVEPAGISFRRWQSGRVIGYTKLVPDFRKSFNAPYYVVHRAHFHDALHRRAVELGVEILINRKATQYDDAAPAVTLASGEVLTADLVVAADGINSTARKMLVRTDKPPLKTGFAAYRATVDVAKMQTDPDVSWLLENPALNIWIGPERHVMTYTIAAGKSFNMVLSHVDHSDPSTWKAENAISEMKEYFRGWDSQLNKIIRMIDKTLKWPLFTGDKVDKWVSDSGKLVVLGDAVHAMVPYMSQGAAMAVEDGAALAEALSNVTATEDLKSALQIFENVRIKRTGQMQQASLLNGMLWHFPDGEIQEARDAALRPEVEGCEFDRSPNQWSDPATQNWAYGYDAAREVREAFRTRENVS